MVAANGEVQRIVSIVALRIYHPRNGTLLVQLGKCIDDQLSVACQLPGGKQERGELAADAVQRFLRTKLVSLVGQIVVTSMERETREKYSKDFGIRTKYLRTICSTSFEACHLDGHPSSGAGAASGFFKAPICPTRDAMSPARAMSEVSLRSGSSASHSISPASSRKMLSQLLDRDVYVVHDYDACSHVALGLSSPTRSTTPQCSCSRKHRFTFYAWLMREEFEQLERGMNDIEVALRGWFASLDLGDLHSRITQGCDPEV